MFPVSLTLSTFPMLERFVFLHDPDIKSFHESVLPQMDFFRVPEPLLQLVYIQLDLELCRRDEVLTLEGALLLAKDATWINLDHILTSNLFPSMKTVGLRLRFNLHHRQQTVMLPEIKSALLWSFSQLDKSSAIEFTLYVD